MRPPDEYATLAAIWILASNDEMPLMTYRGIAIRLERPEGDVRRLVRQHAELFRQRIPTFMLEQWKRCMKEGTRSFPVWIQEAKDEERPRLIDALVPDDGFRSQFRSDISSPRSDIGLIEWGLGYIEKLRKADSEARAATATRSQMWLVLATSILGVAATIVAALLKK